MQNLVIVESPAKAKTIEKFLGKDYKVMPSYGHIRDLKKKTFSIDTDTFIPVYEIPDDKKEVVNKLMSLSENADMVWLASDEDREGEAISWHLTEVLRLKPENTKRIVFHEITKNAILQAIEKPRNIDLNLVNAQQARRVLDRIVGFELSPVLWKKVKPALSAGRVQSVTVKLIVEREREIQAFQPKAAFRITADFTWESKDGKTCELKAELAKRFSTEKETIAFLENCKDAQFTISEVEKHPIKKYPAPPFTTSTLQQEASRKLGLSVAQTMRLAQGLYESGKITYMRTDSVNLSSLAINTSRKAIAELMGEEYVHNRQFTNKVKGAQEAHEAIRPTYIEQATIEGTGAEKRLYDLIWKRTIASQMAEAELEKTTVTISMDNNAEQFVATGEIVKFDGFLKVYRESTDDDAAEDENYVCLIEEYFPGSGLESYLTEHLLSEKEISHILTAVCGILTYLHTRPGGPILYLDLKPEHIILSGDRVSLIDYGICRSLQNAHSGKAIPVFGTRDWCSPEAAAGGEVSVRSDIYSLGRLAEALYERCSDGRKRSVSAVIMKSLATEPSERQETVADWKDAYLAAISQEKSQRGCLSQTVAVAGTERGAGATHVALALTVYLNRTGRKAVYINRSGRAVTRNLVENDSTFCEKADGLIYHAGFIGLPERGPAAEEPALPDAVRVVDCGTDLKRAYDADLVIFVVSSCLWRAGLIDSREPLGQGTAVVLNPARRARGIRMSKALGQKVYGFPQDPDAFTLTHEKERFFRRAEKGLLF